MDAGLILPGRAGNGERQTSGERREAGRARRAVAPRAAQGDWRPKANRRDPIETLEESSRGRVPELVPIRYGRMLASPFAFLRGSAAVMAADLASTPVSGITGQICGDCHLANFGLFATPERNLVFDVNDFDETLPGPWEWDLKRLAASFVVVGRENNLRDSRCQAIVRVLAASYRRRMDEYADMRALDAWYDRLDDQRLLATAPDAVARQRREAIVAKARASVTEYLFPKISAVVDGHRRLVDQPPLVFHPPARLDDAERLARLMAQYHDTLPADRRKLFERYCYEDYAFKVVGVGSVGTRCYVLLYLADDDDPLLLQVKEGRQSVLEPYAGASQFDHSGQRIVIGQRLMQAASDIFLGWTTGPDGTHYYIRQLRDMKFSVPLTNVDAKALANYATVCGWALARAHAKGGDAAMIAGYLGGSDAFDQALARFAFAYADQTERDHATLVRAVKSGRIQAQTDA
jgi:uncharacterized protein (DUF2252 family)